MYTRVLELEPDNPIAYNNRGFAYYALSDYRRALLDFNRAIQLSQRASYYTNKGLSHISLSQYNSATIAFNRAVEINPDYSDSYWGLGNTYYETGQFTLALQNYCRYLEIAEDPLQIAFDRIEELGGCPETES